MQESRSVLDTFEEGDEVVYVHAYRSVMNGWRLGLTIVAGRNGHGTTTRIVTAGDDTSFASAADATQAGRRLALHEEKG